MSLLPRQVQLLRIKDKGLKLFFYFTLITSSFNTAHAAADPGGPPDPQPCQNAQETNELTDIYIPGEDGKNAPITVRRFDVTAPNNPDNPAQVTIQIQERFPIDFSKLQALFATTNSNYLEGRFQNEQHRLTNITGLSHQELNEFHAAGQKTTQKIIVDDLKSKYVKYIWDNPNLMESINTYTDIHGQGDPKTVQTLVNELGLPEPPTSSASESEEDAWEDSWGMYWEKIPTAYREFYKGKVEFRAERNAIHTLDIVNGEDCPETLRSIEFATPEFSRTKSVSDQLNMTMVPCAAQSWQHGTNNNECGTGSSSSSQNILTKTINDCWEIIKSSTEKFGTSLKNVVKISLEILNPIKLAFALEDEIIEIVGPDPAKSCIKILGKEGKEGSAPYCAVEESQLVPGDRCAPNGNDPNKLNASNNVVCDFVINYSLTFIARQTGTVPFDQMTKEDFDTCIDNGAGGLSCNVAIRIWPVISVPFLSEIWNSALYSDEIEGQTSRGVGSLQKTGRPGIYTYFIPKSVSNEILPATHAELEDRCVKEGDQSACDKITEEIANCGPHDTEEQKAAYAKCIRDFFSSGLPGRVQGAGDANEKQRFVGGVDCAKEFVRDLALKPRAVQQALGITNICDKNISPPSGTNPPGGSTQLDYYIKYGDVSILPQNTQAIKNLANSSFPSNNIHRWDDVVNGCASRGISPAFCITIWWEEGGFGSANAGANSEFGCFPSGDTSQILSFDESFNCFLNFTAGEHPYNPGSPQQSFAEWVRYFCGPAADPICSNEPTFIPRLKSVYNSVAPNQLINVNI